MPRLEADAQSYRYQMAAVDVLGNTFFVGEWRYLVKIVADKQMRAEFFAYRKVNAHSGCAEKSALVFSFAQLVTRITGPKIDKKKLSVFEQIAAE